MAFTLAHLAKPEGIQHLVEVAEPQHRTPCLIFFHVIPDLFLNRRLGWPEPDRSFSSARVEIRIDCERPLHLINCIENGNEHLCLPVDRLSGGDGGR